MEGLQANFEAQKNMQKVGKLKQLPKSHMGLLKTK